MRVPGRSGAGARGAGRSCRLIGFATATATAALLALTPSDASAQNLLAPLVAPGAEAPPSPWRAAGLPQQTLQQTRFAAALVDGEPALRVEADASYGNLVHDLGRSLPAGSRLAWRWRVERFAEGADLRRKEGDDAAAKVCVLWDLPLAQVPFVERQLLRLARQRSGEALPSATVCYVWDAALPAGTRLDNAYSRRVRLVVLRGAGDAAGRWQAERRDLAADFLQAFGDEAEGRVPPVLAIAVGADADNTRGRSLAHISALELRP